MPEEKEYGYARDMEDATALVSHPEYAPEEVTVNAIELLLRDFPEEQPQPAPGTRSINNHDYILEIYGPEKMVAVKENLDAFDADQRAAIVTASGSKETEESDESDDEADEQ